MTRLFSYVMCAYFALALSACAENIKSQKIGENTKPVQDVTIVIWLGDTSRLNFLTNNEKSWYANQFKNALQKRMPAIFKANGISVRSMTTAFAFQHADNWPQAFSGDGKATHILVISAESFSEINRGRSINFEAYLWNVSEKRAVWKAEPKLGLGLAQPLLKTQFLTGQLLNGMKTEGLITLKAPRAVDLTGEVIPENELAYLATQDR
jgi:hypothetical protein